MSEASRRGHAAGRMAWRSRWDSQPKLAGWDLRLDASAGVLVVSHVAPTWCPEVAVRLVAVMETGEAVPCSMALPSVDV